MYTNLSTDNDYLWKRIETQLDKYATFSLDGEPMTNYHTFIVNNKGSLQFYNGPSFSNSYTTPQFGSASSYLSGVSFKMQQISFTIAVYAVTDELYRKLIHKLDPYSIYNLSFGFNTKYRYIVKLANRVDSTRYIVGHTADNHDLFYTEFKLTFDIQGDAVAYTVQELGWQLDSTSTIPQLIFNDTTVSELDTPFVLTFGINQGTGSENPSIKCYIRNNSDNADYQLFNVVFNKIFTPLTLEYNSQTGDLCLVNGNDRELLTLLSKYNSGSRIINTLYTNSMLLPGSLEDDTDWKNLSIRFLLNNCSIDLSDKEKGYGCNCYGRINLI